MKRMVWNNGHKRSPLESGYYLCWNPWEDSMPTVCFYDKTKNWWTYRISRFVVDETLGRLFDLSKEQISEALCKIVPAIGTEKQRQKFIGYLHELINGDEVSEEIEFAINSVSESFMEQSGADYVYDIGSPDYWSDLPQLYDDNFDDDPNNMGVVCADMSASVTNYITDKVSEIVSVGLSNISSPWNSIESPWSKKQ